MSKNLDKSSDVTKSHSGAYGLLLFLSLAVFIFLFRGFLFNEYGGVTNPLVGAIIPFLVLMLTLFTISISPVFFRMISLEKNGEDRGIMALFKESVVKYKDANVFIFFLILFAITITIWFKTYNYRGQVSDLFFIEDIYHYSIYIGIMAIAILISLRAIDIFHSVDNINLVIGDKGEFWGSLTKLDSCKFFFAYIFFILLLGAFLSDLFKRSGHEAMGGVFLAIFILIVSISTSALIFMEMLITTKEIKKTFLFKMSFLLITIIVTIFLFTLFYRTFWINVYL